MAEITATLSQENLLVASTNLTASTLDSVSQIADVDTNILGNGSVLVYKTTTNKWTSTTTLDAQNMEGGEF
jgi:hypothetical protein